MNNCVKYTIMNPRLRQVAWGFMGDNGTNGIISEISDEENEEYHRLIDEGFENKGCSAPELEEDNPELPDYMVMEGWEFI